MNRNIHGMKHISTLRIHFSGVLISYSRTWSIQTLPVALRSVKAALGFLAVVLRRGLEAEYHGVSPSEYRERIRHERACRLLQSPQFSIKEISDQLGYCSQLYFSSAFKKKTGLSPSAYLRAHWTGE